MLENKSWNTYNFTNVSNEDFIDLSAAVGINVVPVWNNLFAQNLDSEFNHFVAEFCTLPHLREGVLSDHAKFTALDDLGDDRLDYGVLLPYFDAVVVYDLNCWGPFFLGSIGQLIVVPFFPLAFISGSL